MSEFKDLFIPAICGSFIGYLIYSFIKGLTNDMFYRIGYAVGQFIADRLKDAYRVLTGKSKAYHFKEDEINE